MEIKYVQFSDNSETVITSVFGCPQDPESYPFQGEVQDDDERYLAFTQLFLPTHPDPLAEKQAQKDALLAAASQAMTPILLALQLEGSDSATEAARAWRAYYVELQAVDITVESPEWPVAPD